MSLYLQSKKIKMRKKNEQEFDLIGGNTPLTALEEKELHDYFKQQKLNKILEPQSKKLATNKKRTTTKKKQLTTAS
jgi:hypothetical protein